MANIGINEFAYPDMTILIGDNPMVPQTRTDRLPVPASARPTNYTGGGATAPILSGMIMTKNAAGSAWARGVDTAVPLASRSFYFAKWNSIDSNEGVKRAFLGYDCGGQFIIATPFFVYATPNSTEGQPPVAIMYKEGMSLTACLPGEVNCVPVGGEPSAPIYENRPADGCVRPAAAGEPIIGVATLQGISFANGAANAEAADPNGTFNLNKNIYVGVKSGIVAANNFYLCVKTSYVPGNLKS